jgi:hypothetical protein
MSIQSTVSFETGLYFYFQIKRFDIEYLRQNKRIKLYRCLRREGL